MTTKEILALNTGDYVNYRGKVGYVIDWKCHHEPVFSSEGTRIDAEPIFKWSDGLKHTIHPSFWHEVSNSKKLERKT